MEESKNRRKTPDRRKQRLKNFPNDRREKLRRKEDKDNKSSYYLMLIMLGSILIFMITIAMIFDK